MHPNNCLAYDTTEFPDAVDDEVVSTVASYLNSHPNINSPIIATVSGDMAWLDKSMLESKAHIVVGPYKQIR